MAISAPAVLAASLALAAAASLPGAAVDAFAPPPAAARPSPTVASSEVPRRTGGRRSPAASLLAARPSSSSDDDDDAGRIDPSAGCARLAASGLLAASLLLPGPLVPPPAARAAAPVVPDTATSIDVNFGSLPGLARKAYVDRDKLVGDLLRASKPVLDFLSANDAVKVTPPKDVKGAVNQVLTKGDATFLVNGQSVDVRVESVPGVVVVRVVNPYIPRIPFLRDGSAALQFADDIVDAAPEGVERAAEEVRAIEGGVKALGRFVFPAPSPARDAGGNGNNALGKFLSSESGLGKLTNGEVGVLGAGVTVAGAYGASYSYYLRLQEEAEREAAAKKEAAAAKKKKKQKAAAEAKKKAAAAEAADDDKRKKKAEAKAKAKAEAEAKAKAAEEKKEEYPPRPVMAETEVEADAGAEEAGGDDAEAGEGRRRGRIRRLFGRGDGEK